MPPRPPYPTFKHWLRSEYDPAFSLLTNTIGDVKSGIQYDDHLGWYKLDGRPKASLSPVIQARATAIGIGPNLPDATDAFLSMSTGPLGSVTGSNTKEISRNNLPNVTLTGTTDPDGVHQHNVAVSSAGSTTGWIAPGNGLAAVKEFAHAPGFWTDGANSELTDRPSEVVGFRNNGFIENSSPHTHSFTTSSLNGGVPQLSLDITPKRLVVNFFVFLGLPL